MCFVGSVKMNTGSFKSSEPLERCVEKLDRFQEINFGYLISEQAKSSRFRIKATYLYASKAQKKYRMFQPARGSITQINRDYNIRSFLSPMGSWNSPCLGEFSEVSCFHKTIFVSVIICHPVKIYML